MNSLYQKTCNELGDILDSSNFTCFSSLLKLFLLPKKKVSQLTHITVMKTRHRARKSWKRVPGCPPLTWTC